MAKIFTAFTQGRQRRIIIFKEGAEGCGWLIHRAPTEEEHARKPDVFNMQFSWNGDYLLPDGTFAESVGVKPANQEFFASFEDALKRAQSTFRDLRRLPC